MVESEDGMGCSSCNCVRSKAHVYEQMGLIEGMEKPKKAGDTSESRLSGAEPLLPNAVISDSNLDVRDVILSFRISRRLADRIDRYRIINRRKNMRKTLAVIELLELGLFVVDQATALKDPELVKYLRQNLYNTQLIDDIMNWPQDRIDAVLGALAGEKELRLREKLGKRRT